jgi:hypothetical protein
MCVIARCHIPEENDFQKPSIWQLTFKDGAQTALKAKSVPRCKHFSSWF